MRTRFAPSPTGYLHLGHAFAAYEAFNFAERHGGECLLRIEDIDHTRCKPEYDGAILDDLEWLGFNVDEPVPRQSIFKAGFEKTLDDLRARELIYPCFLTRKEISAASLNGIYLGPKKFLSDDEIAERTANGEKPAWRLSLQRAREALGEKFNELYFEEIGLQVPQAPFGDKVLARKDIGLSYHLCAVHDDALYRMTHIVRGIDIAPHTRFQVLLQKLMGWPTPIYYHHKLLLNEQGKKLAKRNADTTIRSFREAGLSPQEVLDLARGIG
jgi:glutamyl-Q tRNA(Asp) synthetase